MNGNSTRDYLIWDRDDPNYPRLVVARALRSLPLAAVDSSCSPADAWLRGLGPAYYDWSGDVLDADGGIEAAIAKVSQAGWAIRLRGWRDLPPTSPKPQLRMIVGAEDHCPGWFTGHN